MSLLKKIAFVLLSVVGFSTHAKSTAPDKSGTDAMRELRLRALSVPANEFGISPSNEFPRTYAVLIDFPMSEVIVTIVSLSDGSASMYTTSTFGIIGGGSYEKVKVAAAHLVVEPDKLFEEAKPTKDYPYPAKGKVRFYLVSFTDVRVIETDLAAIESNQSKYSSLFWLGQEVMTQLRLETEKK